MGVKSSVLLERLEQKLGLTRPTQIQAKSFAAIRHGSEETDTEEELMQL